MIARRIGGFRLAVDKSPPTNDCDLKDNQSEEIISEGEDLMQQNEIKVEVKKKSTNKNVKLLLKVKKDPQPEPKKAPKLKKETTHKMELRPRKKPEPTPKKEPKSKVKTQKKTPEKKIKRKKRLIPFYISDIIPDRVVIKTRTPLPSPSKLVEPNKE